MMIRAFSIVLFILLGVTLYLGLYSSHQEVGSPLIGKQLPPLKANTLHGHDTFSMERYKGKVWLLNVWASWCEACLHENALLLRLKKQQVPIVGLVYQDNKHSVKQWLKQHGQAFQRVLLDTQGDNAINLGVYGAPETFLIDKQGVIRYKHVGILSANDWQTQIKPLYQQLKGRR